MKITTNAIGNYSFNNIAPKKIQHVTKKNITASPEITNKEKEFFTKMYPAEKENIINYHFYSKTGELSGIALGKNLDRRM